MTGNLSRGNGKSGILGTVLYGVWHHLSEEAYSFRWHLLPPLRQRQVVIGPEVFEVLAEFIKHEGRVDAGDDSSILHLNQFAEILDPVVPGDAVGNNEQSGIGALLCRDSGDIANHVGLFAAGGAVGLGFDQNSG